MPMLDVERALSGHDDEAMFLQRLDGGMGCALAYMQGFDQLPYRIGNSAVTAPRASVSAGYLDIGAALDGT
tara:strand:- start:1862 stop:2074 length:213 start_codon:yes stop_codon:yes gene_type:complete